jgi:hypothetical protein
MYSFVAVAIRRLRDTFIRRATLCASRSNDPSIEIAVLTVDALILKLLPLLLPESIPGSGGAQAAAGPDPEG